MGFEDLLVWQKARELTSLIYVASSSFPSEEKFGLTSQIRRAAVSIAANIAEGAEQDGDASFANYLNIAKGSAGEVVCLLMLSLDQKLIGEDEFWKLRNTADEIRRMIAGLRKKIRERL